MGIFSFVKPGKKVFETIKSVAPSVPKTKLEKAKSKLAIVKQEVKGAAARLKQTQFESKNPEFKGKEFTFSPRVGRSAKVSEKKAKGGRVGLKRGTNLQKIKKTFGPDKNSFQSKMTRKKKKFPDLNKDGKITKADILMGRGVINGKKKKKVI